MLVFCQKKFTPANPVPSYHSACQLQCPQATPAALGIFLNSRLPEYPCKLRHLSTVWLLWPQALDGLL